ncbi:Gfo/Idh/MocA family protein [Stutzerimonas nitrititolerans]|uniref:Gfo/Idh/MocA family protein n=1 Tax=Stutzerimonas nitrititolerans TaxID=2482751 RepID=UPI0028A8550E|nr:Gfo/Idh/MocA family oxidoreductase [Stutzerimonas nitrititolerans]
MSVDKVVVVGMGNISDRHRRNIKSLYPNSTVYAVSASGRLPGDSVPDADIVCAEIWELPIAEMNMAIIASPATLHAEHAIKFIDAGVPTLIEKPLAASVKDAEKIVKSQLNTQTPVAIGYCLRYLPSTLEVRNILKSGMLGEVYNVYSEIGQYLPDWRPGKDYKKTVSASKKLGGGALLELSHELDYLSWLFGDIEPVGTILRSSVELGLDVEDSADILANSRNVVISIHLDFLQKKAYRKCRILGSKGTLEWDLIKNEIVLTDKESIEVLFDGGKDDRNKMYLAMISDFQNHILSFPNSCITINESLKTVQLIEKLKHMAGYN